MNKKIVFFDIDGTLSREDNFTIPESTIKAIYKAKENGHLMFINTGRCFGAIEKQIKDLPMDGYICGCGSNIYYQNKEIYHHKLSDNLRKKVIEASFDTKVENVLECKSGTYYPLTIKDKENINFKNRLKDKGLPVYTYNKNDYVPFDKMALWFYEDSLIDKFIDTFKNDLDFIKRADNFYEIIPLGISKATGISKIIDLLNIDINDTISIGDSTNDLPMLKFTKESIAMGNSNPAILDHVTYVTSDIKEDGIYNALKHFKLI